MDWGTLMRRLEELLKRDWYVRDVSWTGSRYEVEICMPVVTRHVVYGSGPTLFDALLDAFKKAYEKEAGEKGVVDDHHD